MRAQLKCFFSPSIMDLSTLSNPDSENLINGFVGRATVSDKPQPGCVG